MRTILIFLFTFITSISSTIAQQISDQEFSEINKYIGQSRIIGLGEEEHFYRESNIDRIEIIKALINERLINSIVFEYPATDTYLVNEYINNKISKSSLLTALKQAKRLNSGPFFDSKEMLSFIDWIKSKNQKDHTIQVYGMDFYNYIAALETLQKQRRKNSDADNIKQTLDTLTYYLKNNPVNLMTKESMSLAVENLSMVKKFISRVDTSLSSSLKYSATDLYNYSYWFTDLNNRDSLMFENFVNIDNGDKKCLIWAANFHIQDDSLTTPNYTAKLLGNLMTKKYKEQYYKIGVMSTNPCEQDKNKKVIQPGATCGIKNKLDLVVLIQKGDITPSIFD